MTEEQLIRIKHACEVMKDCYTLELTEAGYVVHFHDAVQKWYGMMHPLDFLKLLDEALAKSSESQV